MGRITDFEDFCGRADAEGLLRSLGEFFQLAEGLRDRLGDQGYLLDRYLELLLSAAAVIPLHLTGEQGLQSAATLRGAIRCAMQGEAGDDGTLRKTARAYVKAYPLPWQECYTRHSLYFAALFGVFARQAVREYQVTLAKHIRTQAPLDLVRLREVRRDICASLADEEDMALLDGLFQAAFLSVSPMAGFLQGLSGALLAELISRDEETSKPIFRLLLDSGMGWEA